MPTFAELYCQRYGVPMERFLPSMFWRCLHRRAWWLVPLVRLTSSNYFTADYDLIRDVGRLTQARGLSEDLADFHTHPLNGGFCRRKLRLRLSVRRVTREVNRLLPGRAPAQGRDAAEPVGATVEGAPSDRKVPPHSASN